MADKAKKAADALAAKRSECVRVVVRIRPMNDKEKADGYAVVVNAASDRGEILLKNPRADDSEMPKVFTFDAAFGPDCTQKGLYDITASPIVDNVMEGYNGTIFAYGQTGAGKSHTMEGTDSDPGIIPFSFRHIFDKIALSDGSSPFLVRASYIEIYNEEIRDLLSKDPSNKLELRENVDSGVYVKDLTTFVVKSAGEILALKDAGKRLRHVGQTNMNSTSSRSHSIFTVTIETCETREDGSAHIRVGKLNMVDLAGSERQSKTGATGDRLKEATKINLSLSALGNVISALVDSNTAHIPYRDSKLTRLLQDSLGGNTKTVMIANCGPADYNYDETLSTLRYASRAKQIKNKPRINEDPKDAMLREFQEEIERLRKALMEREAGGGGGGTITLADGTVVPAKVERVIEKQIVEKIVEVEKHVGVSEEKVKQLQEAAERERQEILRKEKEARDQLALHSAKTEEERRKLEEELKKQAEAQAAAEAEASAMRQKLETMQEKLIMGGHMADKAAAAEAELRRAQVELEERARQELSLARELEEANMMIEEQYASMQEEVEMKTKKLKKALQKWQQAKAEVKDLQEEFQAERSEFLDTIRELQQELKRKQLIIDNFIPPEEVERVESRARWDDEKAVWVLPRLEISGNNIRGRRPVVDSITRAPESEYARRRGAYDSNPRYKADNVAGLEADLAERSTLDYNGAMASRRVEAAMNAALGGEDEDEMAVMADGLPAERKKKDRPKTASRRKGRDETAGMAAAGGAGGGGYDAYPSARGLVMRS